jgi:hypothetical protein
MEVKKNFRKARIELDDDGKNISRENILSTREDFRGAGVSPADFCLVKKSESPARRRRHSVTAAH